MALQERSLRSVAELLTVGEFRSVFQPIVEICSGQVVGYEALARGPVGSPLELPGALFSAAASEGLLATFDRACRERALSDALSAGLGPDDLLFLNVEPAGLGEGDVLDAVLEADLQRVSVVVELTERALTARPSEVLGAVRWLRERNCRIALDDVGVDHRSLALMPFLSPDVIKLDRSVVQERLRWEDTARVLNAVGAEAERSGAVILAEGIETEAHRRRARAMGAKLGQGWLFGRPGAIEGPSERLEAPPVPRHRPRAVSRETPYRLVASTRPVLEGDKRLLLALSRQLEQESLGNRDGAVVLTCFQEAAFFTPSTSSWYESLAESAALVGALGVGMPSAPGVGVRGADLAPDDPLRGEWNVIVIGPHFAGAMVARDLGDTGPDLERRFEYCVTYDRDLTVRAADTLLRLLLRSQ